ncbi:MAG: response regulator [Bacteroidia bacterium]
MPKRIKLIIVDDHELIRKGYTSLLTEDPEIKVIGEAENGKALLEMLKTIQPDIIILDLDMPVMNGDVALPIINKRYPEIKVIIVSMHYSDTLVSEFLSKGACAYLNKNISPEIFIKAVHAVKEKGLFIDEEMTSVMLQSLKDQKKKLSYPDKSSLTPRETEIVKLRALGNTYKEIADALCITPRTVDYHCQNIYSKINAETNADLVLFAVKSGILNINDSFHGL